VGYAAKTNLAESSSMSKKTGGFMIRWSIKINDNQATNEEQEKFIFRVV
jgi:hypothetical protein